MEIPRKKPGWFLDANKDGFAYRVINWIYEWQPGGGLGSPGFAVYI